ncbi:MAG: hypothetical protein MUO82_02230 [Candidatus Thermoplasmatota archaeon]|nr:hypothetical protein [Candidatus Thermoplasmatota archaeon]
MLNKRILLIGLLVILISISFAPSLISINTLTPSTINAKVLPKNFLYLAKVQIFPSNYSGSHFIIKRSYNSGICITQITPIIPSGKPYYVFGICTAHFLIGNATKYIDLFGKSHYRIEGYAIQLSYTDFTDYIP